MFQTINRCFFALSFILIIWSSTIVLMAQNSGESDSEKKLFYDASDWCNQNVPVNYWLTSKQISGILYLKSKYDEIILPEITKLDAMLNTLNKNPGEFDKQAESSKIEIQRLEDKIFELRLEARIEIRKILGTSQTKYFDDFVFSKWWSYQQQKS